ncbi:MAG: invasion associated locus B family protein [Paracoccaceae bacterium]
MATGVRSGGARRLLMAAAAAVTALTAGAMQAPEAAAQTANRVEAFRDWSVFTADDNGPVCWVATEPKSSEARRGGQAVRVRRGDIYMMVAVRPEQGVANEVSVVAGYPYRGGSDVEARIGDDRFELFTEGEHAWPRPEDDGRLIESMKAGVTAVVTGVSARGTTTTDRFSLLGFTDALTAAQARCG